MLKLRYDDHVLVTLQLGRKCCLANFWPYCSVMALTGLHLPLLYGLQGQESKVASVKCDLYIAISALYEPKATVHSSVGNVHWLVHFTLHSLNIEYILIECNVHFA